MGAGACCTSNAPALTPANALQPLHHHYSFPTNFFGCDSTSPAFTGGVRFIQEDIDLECAGTDNGRCASRPNMK